MHCSSCHWKSYFTFVKALLYPSSTSSNAHLKHGRTRSGWGSYRSPFPVRLPICMLVVVVVVVVIVVVGSSSLLLCRCCREYALARALVHAPLQLAQHQPDSRHSSNKQHCLPAYSRHSSSQQHALQALLARLLAHASMLFMIARLIVFAYALALDISYSDL